MEALWKGHRKITIACPAAGRPVLFDLPQRSVKGILSAIILQFLSMLPYHSFSFERQTIFLLIPNTRRNQKGIEQEKSSFPICEEGKEPFALLVSRGQFVGNIHITELFHAVNSRRLGNTVFLDIIINILRIIPQIDHMDF